MARPRFGPNILTRLFADAKQPIYVLNGEREIVFCNAACEAWTGVAADELLGKRCDYHSVLLANRTEEIAARLCPAPQVFAGEQRTGSICIQQPDGTESQRTATYQRLVNAQQVTLAVIVTVSLDDETSAALPPSELDSPDVLHAQLQKLRVTWDRRYQLEHFIGTSAVANRVRDQLRFAIAGRGRTLIVGPDGSGREHAARTIHAGRATSTDSPLLPIDCVLLDADLVRTAVDAFLQHARHLSKTVLPTLLLLNVDRATAAAQNELAQYCLSPREKITTLTTARTALTAAAELGNFRADLAHGLSTFTIELPPLVNRSEDILLLAQTFLEEANRAGGKQLGGFSSEALRQLALYPWPKNLDELSDVVLSAWEQAEGMLVNVSDLPSHLRVVAAASTHPRRPPAPINLDELLADIEKELLDRALRQAKGNKAKAAQLLSISRARLLRTLNKHGLQ